MFRISMLMCLLIVMTTCFVACDGDDDDNTVGTDGGLTVAKVIGSIDGIVQDTTNNEPLDGFYVVYWSGDQSRDSVLTSGNGSFSIPEELSSGEYYIMIVDPADVYNKGYAIAYIPALAQLQGDIIENPPGEIHYRVSFIDFCEADECLGPILLSKK